MRKARARQRAKVRKGKETRVRHECDEPTHLRKDCSVYKKRFAVKGNKEKVETSAAVQGAMVETWEYIEEDYVFAFGEAVIAAVQTRDAHLH